MFGTRWGRSALVAMLLGVGGLPAAAQTIVPTTTISTANASCSVSPTSCAIANDVRNAPSIGVYVDVGTSGTFHFEQMIEEEVWIAVADDVNTATSATADGAFFFTNPGFRKFRVRASAITGNATVRIERGFANLRSTATLSGASQGDGALQDGANSAIEATVLDLTNANPLTVAITDANGSQITAFGGGTQFAVDAPLGATPTGTLSLAKRDDALSALTPVEGDAVDLRVDGVGALWTTISGSVQVVDAGGSITVDNAGTFPVQAIQVGAWTVTADAGIGTFMVGDGAGALTVDGTVAATQSGTWTVQPGNTANTTPWLTSLHDGTTLATVRNLAANDALNVAIVDTNGNQIASFGGGTQFAEDAASADGHVGTLAMARRTATPANTSGTDLDYEVLQMNAGRLWVDASGVTLTVATHAVTGSGTFTVDGELAAAVLLADNLALPTVPIVGAANLCYDGTNLDLCRTSTVTEATHDAVLTAGSTVSYVSAGRASASAPTNVSADDDAVLAWFLRNGSQVVNIAAGSTLLTGTGTSLNVNCTGGCASTSIADDAPFTVGTSTVAAAGYLLDDTTPDTVNEGDIGAPRMSAARIAYAQLRDAAGNERGANVTAANALVVDGSAVTQPISGTITANAGTGTFATNLGQVGGQDVVTAGLTGTLAIGGPMAFDAAAAAISPLLMGCYSSQAAPTDVSADNDATRLWCLRNGSPVMNLAAGGTLITATSTSLNVNVTGGTITTITNTVGVQGAKTHNTAAPGATNVGALVAVANAAAPSYTEGNLVAASVDLAGALRVAGSISCSNCSGSGASDVDDSSFTIATDSVAPAGFLLDDTTPDTVNEGDVGLARMSANRVVYQMIRDGAGNERGANVTAANALVVDNSAVTQPVSNAGTFAVQLSTNVVEDAPETVGVTGPMVLAVRRDTLASSAGTSGDNATFNTTSDGALWSTFAASTNGGCTPGSIISAASVNETEIKASPGQIYAVFVSNTNVNPRYIKFYNDTAANTDETDTPVWRFLIPPSNSGFMLPLPPGAAFSTAITFRVTTGAADNDTGAVSANEHLVSYCFK